MDHSIVDRFYAEFARHLHAGDLEGLLSLYEPDAVIVRGPGDHVSGQAAMRTVMQGFIDTKGKISFKVRYAVQHGDIALLSNEYTLQGTDAAGKPFTMTGKTTEVIRRQPDGRWLFIIDHPSGAEG
jgi:uncharacterized protein (TIGR02246 family)